MNRRLMIVQNCGDVLTKKKLDPHRNQCRGASYTCLDCMVHFQGTEYRSHTSCMSEAQKYEGALYRDPKEKQNGKARPQKTVKIQETAIVPRKAYVEDEPEGGAVETTIAVIDVPPAAPSPPPAADVNVFDFLVTDESPDAQKALAAGNELQPYRTEVYEPDTDMHYATNGYTYGDAPLEPGYNRYDSRTSLVDQHGRPLPDAPYLTPAPKGSKEFDSAKADRRSSNKRKRHQPEELDMARVRNSPDHIMTDVAPVLHSGLTGGLSRLLSRPSDALPETKQAPSPLSPLKRSKKSSKAENGEERRHRSSRHHEDDGSDTSNDRGRRHRHHREGKSKHRTRRGSSSSDEHRRPSRKQVKAIEYRNGAAESSPPGESALVRHPRGAANGLEAVDPAEVFLSFITKGPDSERGQSINKALKRYHREQGSRGDREKEERDKELWKGLRLKRNERGEVVVFF